MFLHSIFIFFTILGLIRGEDICKTCKCNTNAQILSINCANLSLHDVGVEWPTENIKIVKASFAGNDMATLEPLPFTNSIVEIVLSKCNIKYLKPKLFADSQNVKFVDLSYNFLEAGEISSEKFAGPYNTSFYEPIGIEHLDLSYNQIHSLGKNVFEHMPNLKILDLEGNDFTVLDIQTQLALSSIRQLQSLNLANNELTEMIVGAIEAHDNLTELNLSFNDLDFVPRSLAEIGKSLEKLNIDSNPIIEFTSETFFGLGNIIELSANNLTKLKYVNANTFTSMPKLKKLNLSNNFRLVNIDREAFGVDQKIEEFYLNNNDLYRIDYKLLPWSQLQVFEFDLNPLECSCDLYNITNDLSKDITRKDNGPFCMDPRTERYIQVFYLKSDICNYKPHQSTQIEYIQYHFSLVRVALIILSIIVMVAAFVAAILGFIKYRRYRRESSYPYASQIAYNPVSTTPKF